MELSQNVMITSTAFGALLDPRSLIGQRRDTVITMPAFARRVSKETIGCPRPFNACADPVVCNGMGLYLQVTGEVVSEAYWWCGECSPAERVTLEIACQLLCGSTLDSVHHLGVQAFAAAGGETIDDLPMTC